MAIVLATESALPAFKPRVVVVTFLPKMSEHSEPGRVSSITRKSSLSRGVDVQIAMEALVAIDVREGIGSKSAKAYGSPESLDWP
jgi:hypothetical protein